MDWFFLVLFCIAAAALMVFLIWRNEKDKKNYMGGFGRDYRKPKDKKKDKDIDKPK